MQYSRNGLLNDTHFRDRDLIPGSVIPHSEVYLSSLVLLSRTGFLCRLRTTVNPFPMQTALPPSEYYGLIRLPKGHRSAFVVVGTTYLLEGFPEAGTIRASQVPGASLHACHTS